MATHHHQDPRAPETRPARQPLSPMNWPQLHAYLLARETLRRLKRSASPCFARDPSSRPGGSRYQP